MFHDFKDHAGEYVLLIALILLVSGASFYTLENPPEEENYGVKLNVPKER